MPLRSCEALDKSVNLQSLSFLRFLNKEFGLDQRFLKLCEEELFLDCSNSYLAGGNGNGVVLPPPPNGSEPQDSIFDLFFHIISPASDFHNCFHIVETQTSMSNTKLFECQFKFLPLCWWSLPSSTLRNPNSLCSKPNSQSSFTNEFLLCFPKL